MKSLERLSKLVGTKVPIPVTSSMRDFEPKDIVLDNVPKQIYQSKSRNTGRNKNYLAIVLVVNDTTLKVMNIKTGIIAEKNKRNFKYVLI
jgi:hypothetical protein